MRKKIFISIFVSAAALLAICLLLTMSILFHYFEAVQKRQLAAECSLAAQGVESAGTDYFNQFKTDSFRITLINSDGTVLYDSAIDATTMENHAEREEVKEASVTGIGESERYSNTLLEKNIYYAKRLTNSSIIRTCVTQSSIWALLLGMLPSVCLILIGALIISIMLANGISKRIVRPLNSLDLEKPLDNNTYEEISPLLNRIEHLHRNINTQIQLLKQKQDEFSAVTDGMNEGLVLLGNDNTVLSINRAATELFNTDHSCIGNNFLTICRNTTIRNIISSATKKGGHSAVIEISGRDYHISATPVITDGVVNGVCLLAFDMTEKMQSERIRREFTANVSHELKTPLHTIMGTAELLNNQLVAQEDIPHFTEMIMNESSRLLRLVNDIIHLSQLDEAANLPTERVDLCQLAREVIDTLHMTAEERLITLELCGKGIEILGVRPLLYEIIYNLCDNAIRYNVPNGKVKISITKLDSCTELSVCDTGIGIQAEHQTRVFERFYRVDKSRSRACGGTGLGLSIVKHAAEYHNAQLKLKSIEGNGTEITLVFPD